MICNSYSVLARMLFAQCWQACRLLNDGKDAVCSMMARMLFAQ